MFHEYVQAIVLGIVQGIAEFLPISSKGHLVVAGQLLQRLWGGSADPETDNLFLIVVLHLGTLASLMVVYRRDLWKLLRDWRLCALIVLATIPAAAIGFAFKKQFEAAFDQPVAAACGWLVTAALLWTAQRLGRGEKTLGTMTVRDAGIVGWFQVAALFPGISRSGTTIAGGLLSGLSREASAAFSFLIAIPVIAGAVVVKVGPIAWHVLRGDLAPADSLAGFHLMPLLAGAATSFVVGVVSLRWLLRVIVQRGLNWFAYYLVVAAALTFAWQAVEALNR